ncbi:LLM class flavin-dependent oxidoreductase [Amycolatopsis anabasis]|uniref:LLM class flavin-dependent oxidoreductase n=1 Tax=Amycolatopsis anabasis TaxID=1840409 RepID=UPI00131D55B0|nr:LLM class flavin-dependent oxidoreductase [Amycolatopsis anabasis]
MRIGLLVETQEGVTWPSWLAIAHACESAGLEGLFLSDHYLPLRGKTEDDDHEALDAWTLIAALAARTERLRFGTLVTPVTFRHPAVLTKAVATADHLSGGRVELGLGTGWYADEHLALGLPFPSTKDRMVLLEEQLSLLRRFFAPKADAFHGRHYRTEPVELRPTARPPILVGGEGGPKTIRLAAAWADEYNTIRASPAECRERAHRVRRAWADAGRDPATARLSLMTTCVTGRDEREVADRLRLVLDRYGRADPDGFRAKLSREAIVGTTEQVAEQVHALAAAGVTRVVLRHLLPRDLDMIELIGAGSEVR